MAWVYFSSALIKLRVAGLSYFSPDNLPALAIMHSLDNLHDTQFRFAFWLPAIRQYFHLPLVSFSFGNCFSRWPCSGNAFVGISWDSGLCFTSARCF